MAVTPNPFLTNRGNCFINAIAVSLSRSVGTGRREPWERGWTEDNLAALADILTQLTLIS